MKYLVLILMVASVAQAQMSPQNAYNLVKQAVAQVRFNEKEHGIMAESLKVLKDLVEKSTKKKSKKKKKSKNDK